MRREETALELAILIHAKRDCGPARNTLLRPFADSSLFEIALEKLSNLDAPCKKYVAVADRETKQIVGRYHGLQTVRRDQSEGEGASQPIGEFGYLAKLPEKWFLVINPLFPLVSAETWWEACEAFLAEEPHAWTAAERLEGKFWGDDDGALNIRPDRVLLRSTDAFRIVEKSQIATKENEREHATPFMIPGTATWGIHEMEDITAVEAVYSMSQLGIFA